MSAPLLSVQGLVKQYRRGWPKRHISFDLRAEFEIDEPCIVGVMGANGAGKTTLFELITGGNQPTAGRVRLSGQDVHQVRYAERDRLAMHYHQSYQVRAFKRTKPSFMLEHARSERARVHLFDEPQFNAQDGYIGFMLDFFRRLRDGGKLVFLCLHPNEPMHLDILAEVCDRHMFIHKDDLHTSRLLFSNTLGTLMREPKVTGYLGALASRQYE
ncbi:MAG: ATP-binding cassette domain-containing protein [Rubrivivax sp.]